MNSHDHTVYSILSNDKKAPLVRLSGQWLANCGFKPGCNYTVSELSGCLLLMVDKKNAYGPNPCPSPGEVLLCGFCQVEG